MRYQLLVIPLFAAACAEPITSGKGPSPMIEGVTPPFFVTSGHQTLPASCLRKTQPGFGLVPPGCTRDTVFAAQVADPRDLVRPVIPGAAPLVPSTIASSQLVQSGIVADEPGGDGEDAAQ